MFRLLRVTLSIVLLAVAGCASAFVLFARHNVAAESPALVVPELIEQNISGRYPGTIYLRNNRKQGYQTTLYINEDKTFQLVSDEKQLVSGRIEVWIIPEKDYLAAGRVSLDNEKNAIEIRWHHNPFRDVIKILQAQGARRKFRFCSQQLREDECFGTVSAQ